MFEEFGFWVLFEHRIPLKAPLVSQTAGAAASTYTSALAFVLSTVALVMTEPP